MQEHDSHVGQVLDGRYRVERLLGKGGMGAVYEGKHVIVGKRVAIKTLHPEFAANEEVLKRFYREAQTAAAIGHKNIIDIMDVGVTPTSEPYIVMEYLEGEDLESMLKRTGPLSVEAACGILEPALLALGAAHEKGIVHRDLKPANIFLVRGKGAAPVVKLIDFGISKISGGAGNTRLTQTGLMLGTPAYMSPEQARGLGAVDHRTDIYAMGVISYQMLTGRLPFANESYNALLISVLTEEPPPLRAHRPELPADAEALVLKELSKDPALRSQTAIEMLEAFRQLAAFSERDSGMSLLGTQLERRVASGDLGSVIDPSGSSPASASRVLSQLAKATPGAWAGTAAKRGPNPALIAGIAAGVLVLGVAGFLVVRGVAGGATATTGPSSPAVPAAAPAALDEGVLVSVKGAPEGATVYFNGAPVPMNPFRVARAKTIFPLRVEAAGFEAFVTSVVPAGDLVVDVAMKPAAAPVADEAGIAPPSKSKSKKKKTHSEAAAPTPAAPTPAAGATEPSPQTPPKAEGSIKKGKKGTMVSSDFE
jgi:serine/threonine-protein kinase